MACGLGHKRLCMIRLHMPAQLFIASDRSLALIDQSLVSACNFLATLMVGRFAGVSEFSSFVLAYTSVFFLGNLHRALVTQPLNVLGASEAAAAVYARAADLLRAHVWLIPIAVLLLVLTGLRFFPSANLLASVALYLVLYMLQEFVRRWWYTRGLIGHALRLDLLMYGGQVLGLLALGLAGKLSAAAAFVVMSVVAGLCVLVSLPLLGTMWRCKAVRAGVRANWQLGKWLLATVLASWLANHVFPYLLVTVGPEAVAMFAAARNLLNVVNVLVQTANNYLPTQLRRLMAQGDAPAVRGYFVEVLAIVGLGAGLVCLCAAIWSPSLLRWVYGPAYASGARVMVVLALGTFFIALGAVVGALSLALGDARSSFIANAVAALFTLSIGLELVHRFGVVGAAVASSVGIMIAVAVQTLLTIRRVRQLGWIHTAPVAA